MLWELSFSYPAILWGVDGQLLGPTLKINYHHVACLSCQTHRFDTIHYLFCHKLHISWMPCVGVSVYAWVCACLCACVCACALSLSLSLCLCHWCAKVSTLLCTLCERERGRGGQGKRGSGEREQEKKWASVWERVGKEKERCFRLAAEHPSSMHVHHRDK